MFARARMPPRSMAGCWVLVTRATPAVGRRAGGAVKAAAVAAKATINFIVQNLSAGSFTTRAPRLDGDLVSLVRLKNASKKKNSVAKNRLSAFYACTIDRDET